MKFFRFVIISILFYLKLIEAYYPELCSGVTYRGDASDDENGETIFAYSFSMKIIYDFNYTPNYSSNVIQVTDVETTYMQNSSLKFHHISYTENYQDCNSLIDIKEYKNFTVPNQEIKFILTFIEDDDDDFSGNDLCQSNKTRFVDTITMFINDIIIFNAENGLFFDYNTFTRDDEKPTEKNFLNGNKSVECRNVGYNIRLPEKAEEICTNYEQIVTLLNVDNTDTQIGQVSYLIDEDFINFSLNSSEGWYIHILPDHVTNSTIGFINYPPGEDFQFPIQLITNFGCFYIGYFINRNRMWLKYNYMLYGINGFTKYTMDTFTFEEPCWNHTFSYQKFNGTIESIFCCTKFNRDWPTTTTTTAITTKTTTATSEKTEMSTLITEATKNIFTTNFLNDKSSNKLPIIILIICGPIGGLSIIILLILLYFYRRKKQQRKAMEKMTSNGGTNILKNLRPDFGNFLLPKISETAAIYDEFETEWNKLIFTTSVLGCGAFGNIIQGKLISGSTKNGIYEHDIIDVAIKMPQKTSSESVCASFLDEIKLMKKINGNKNIIKMIGYVTKGPRICLILEYCCHKDLLHYCKQLMNRNEIKRQTEKEFFIFTWQISHGMQFLASKNIVHCDLAARNILIDKDKNAKISDFGLSVHLESDSIIVKDDARKLPIKWLSLETLKSQEFSLNSDIWSFGVLLYEMYSFGNTPYDEIDEYSALVQYLEEGNRLKKPIFCLDKIYILMMKCWNSIPTLRPSINEIIESFKEFLEESTEGYGYLKILNE